jgi:hypothetical protein
MEQNKPKGAVSHTLEIPQFDANQYWLKTSFDIINSMTQVASALESYNDIKFNTLTEMLLETILDEKLKKEISDKRNDELNSLNDMDTDKRNEEILKINIKIFGQWFQHAKKYMTLEEKLEVFRTAPDV